jgi:hypothetical protein
MDNYYYNKNNKNKNNTPQSFPFSIVNISRSFVKTITSINAKKMINWAELSRTLAGDRSAITKDRIPKKHKETIESLINSVADWLLTLRP